MKTAILSGVLAIGLATSGVAHAGCIKGALVGGVAGHFAGRHTVLGALGGCAVGHHLAVVKKRQQRLARQTQTTTTQVTRSDLPR